MQQFGRNAFFLGLLPLTSNSEARVITLYRPTDYETKSISPGLEIYKRTRKTVKCSIVYCGFLLSSFA